MPPVLRRSYGRLETKPFQLWEKFSVSDGQAAARAVLPYPGFAVWTLRRRLPPLLLSGGASPVTAEQSRQAERVENAAPRPTTPAKPVTAANTAKPNQAGAEGTAPTSPEAARERQIDQFNRKQAAGLDLANNSEIYKQVSERCGQATANRDAAAQRARNFEAQAKEEKDKATALRQKAQSMADGAEKDAVMRQAGSSDQKANEFTAQATEERKNEKENDAIVQENLKKMDEMQKEREQSISDREIDNIMKQKYGNNYRTEQSANINGWNFK